jgi:carboxyl-terminal processing protease
MAQNRWSAVKAALALSTVTLIPITTTAMATVETRTDDEIRRFIDVFLRVKSSYVEPVKDEKLIEGAIQGMLTSLDPHSAYLNVSDFNQLRTTTDGEYGGLGLSVTMEDGFVKVIAPTLETPAARAGIKAGDFITHINGELLAGATLDDAVSQMRGKPGTKITLKIARPGRDKAFDVPLVREVIQLRPVVWELKNDIAVITLSTFSGNAGQRLEKAFADIDAKLGRKPLGYILDLRSNPGGLLDEAVEVSDAFLNKGQIVSQRGRARGESQSWSAKMGDSAGGLPVIVLIDAGSASAAEIVAGALQDNRRALIMGERSFGKGSVQSILPLDREGTTALRITTARYYTPSGKSVQEGGIDPDIKVPQLSDPDYKSRPKVREADLRRHLINEKVADPKLLEVDAKEDPRFTQTPEQLKAQGIEDFQLDYALKTLMRLAQNPKYAQSLMAQQKAPAAPMAPKPKGLQ